jgi:hypothetical protein
VEGEVTVVVKVVLVDVDASTWCRGCVVVGCDGVDVVADV